MIQFVRVYELQDGKDVEVGKILWDGQTFRADPPTPLLHRILGNPITVPMHGRLVQLTAADGAAFLDGLKYHYRSPYLGVSSPQTEG